MWSIERGSDPPSILSLTICLVLLTELLLLLQRKGWNGWRPHAPTHHRRCQEQGVRSGTDLLVAPRLLLSVSIAVAVCFRSGLRLVISRIPCCPSPSASASRGRRVGVASIPVHQSFAHVTRDHRIVVVSECKT